MPRTKSRPADPLYDELKKRQLATTFLDRDAEGILFIRVPKDGDAMEAASVVARILRSEDMVGVSVAVMDENIDLDFASYEDLAGIGLVRVKRKHDA